ncbi:hypothetical protein CARN8_4470007 [mine drainage metagenome]|uniref:Uncharacterized protein n=1 Tax=mine drainage metagenome TaxID=410659 RepID=A0A3P3ZQH2_9ZZZZ
MEVVIVAGFLVSGRRVQSHRSNIVIVRIYNQLQFIRGVLMKAQKILSVLPLAVIGACYGASAWATPFLGSDLASFTVLGSSTVTNVPTSAIDGSVGVWSSGGANAITGFNSSPGVAVSDPQVTGGTVQAGGSVAQLAQSQLTYCSHKSWFSGARYHPLCGSDRTHAWAGGLYRSCGNDQFVGGAHA